MDTIFMYSKNSKTSYPTRLLLNLSEKVNLKIINKYFALSYIQHIFHMEKYKNVMRKL